MLSTSGDIAFVGFNADGNGDLAFVTFVNIGAGETIYFTDNEWDGAAFNTGESYSLWTNYSSLPHSPFKGLGRVAPGGLIQGSVFLSGGTSPCRAPCLASRSI